MGEIRLDSRHGDWRLTFRVGIGKKNIPLRSVVVAKDDTEGLVREVAAGLVALRPKTRP